MPQILIPAILRAQADGQSVVNCSGQTVGELLTHLLQQYPALLPGLMNDSQQLHSFLNLFVDGRNIRDLDQLKTLVAEHQTILIVPALAGG
ncbi:MAG TPA: molybdopterin synthase sulfur carrier subunit [Planctomycetaceae bacterium]|nr:molybdopterin synthase sulfur carrier subunit [Planctomycetaceae bacterium]